MLILAGLGFSSGLPLALTGSTLQAWLVTEGVDIRLIGAFSLVSLPYSIKALWSPVMDRFVPPFMGRRRGWILICQLLLACSLIAMAFLSPSRFITLLAVLAFFTAFFSASQDIAFDAYRTDVVSENEQGTGAAASVMGYRIAMLVSGAFAMVLSDHIPWKAVYILMGTMMILCCILTLTAPEPAEAQSIPRTLKDAIYLPLKDYFSRPRALPILLFIVCFKLGDALAGAMTTPFLMDLGFSRSDIGLVYKTLGLASTLLGAMAGGALTARLGLYRSLWIFALFQAVSNFSFVLLALVGKSYFLMIGTVIFENTTGGMGTAGFIAYLMSLCNPAFTATQYALLSSLTAVTRVMSGVPSGFMVASMGWAKYFLVTVAGAIPAILLLPAVVPPAVADHQRR
ncbi:MFS transporter, PAT family, beta-lactamase induction signal transducer AmpG [Thermodesulforhabdus norvegica]|uniref:MFS transporter, PAT family, beta-lactamase induction signal transducer AmpG n=2 Tax=Thermodesulforhabdus norvegica TaxID=39841 RepID=A0A1I4T5F5_9BACT|nr:MFS transporter [Thermodesulforhabdus norvegica]SFM71865.1 MFS transporter, PAT family, beta-lactamase induction signal transducer AmpG [Thermodesulforhabdus norvegica]